MAMSSRPICYHLLSLMPFYLPGTAFIFTKMEEEDAACTSAMMLKADE